MAIDVPFRHHPPPSPTPRLASPMTTRIIGFPCSNLDVNRLWSVLVDEGKLTQESWEVWGEGTPSASEWTGDAAVLQSTLGHSVASGTGSSVDPSTLVPVLAICTRNDAEFVFGERIEPTRGAFFRLHSTVRLDPSTDTARITVKLETRMRGGWMKKLIGAAMEERANARLEALAVVVTAAAEEVAEEAAADSGSGAGSTSTIEAAGVGGVGGVGGASGGSGSGSGTALGPRSAARRVPSSRGVALAMGSPYSSGLARSAAASSARATVRIRPQPEPLRLATVSTVVQGTEQIRRWLSLPSGYVRSGSAGRTGGRSGGDGVDGGGGEADGDDDDSSVPVDAALLSSMEAGGCADDDLDTPRVPRCLLPGPVWACMTLTGFGLWASLS
jgi:hypothetical protein